MLHVELPLAYILVAVWELHRALAVLLSTLELSVVAATVLELKLALAFEDVLLELSFISLLALREVVDTCKTTVL